MPKSFSEALEDYSEQIPHRGDYYGNGLTYRAIDNSRCVFISSGYNNRFEMGAGDDMVFLYEGKWKVGTIEDASKGFPTPF